MGVDRVRTVGDDVLGVTVNLVPLLERLDVHGADGLALGDQLADQMPANEPAGSGYQNSHVG